MSVDSKPVDIPKIVKISGETVILPSTQVVKISGSMVQIQSGTTIQLPSTQVVKVSGEQVVVNYDGVTTVLFSGYKCTNTIVTSGVGFLQYGKATLSFTNTGGGSGVNYSVIGYTLSGVIGKALTSGTIYSGATNIETITDPYSWLDVGADNTVDDFSGSVTVIAVRK